MRKVIREFLDVTNSRGSLLKFTFLLIIASMLYCMVYSFASIFIYQSNGLIYYGIQYIIVLWAAFVYMVILFQFLMKKRKDDIKLKLKSYVLPLWGVQTIFFILMAGSSFLSSTLIMQGTLPLNSYVLTPLILLLMILYVPLQVLCLLQIYDGKRNPLYIIKDACSCLVKHYQTCFYSLLALVLLAALYHMCMGAFFGVSSSFVPYSAVMDLMVSSNPFMNAFHYLAFVLNHIQFLGPFLVSLVYGSIMCIALVYYYMVMICAYDGNINV